MIRDDGCLLVGCSGNDTQRKGWFDPLAAAKQQRHETRGARLVGLHIDDAIACDIGEPLLRFEELQRTGHASERFLAIFCDALAAFGKDAGRGQYNLVPFERLFQCRIVGLVAGIDQKQIERDDFRPQCADGIDHFGERGARQRIVSRHTRRLIVYGNDRDEIGWLKAAAKRIAEIRERRFGAVDKGNVTAQMRDAQAYSPDGSQEKRNQRLQRRSAHDVGISLAEARHQSIYARLSPFGDTQCGAPPVGVDALSSA